MRHRKSGIKLNRTSSHRQAMFRNMVTSLFKYDRIKTTDAKAKELRRWADHLITLAKRGDLHARRQALAIVREKNVVHKLFEEAQKRFGQISGGYTRIIKIGRRAGDAAPVSIIELVDHDDHARKKKAKKKTKVTKKEPQKAEKQEAKKEDKGEDRPADTEVKPEEAKSDGEIPAKDADQEQQALKEQVEESDGQAEQQKENDAAASQDQEQTADKDAAAEDKGDKQE